MKINEILEILSVAPLFGALNEQDLAAVAAVGRVHQLKDGERLFNLGDPGGTLWVVLAGRLKALVSGADGREIILCLLLPGETLGEIGMIDGGPRSATVMAMEPTLMLALDQQNMQQVLRRHPDVAIRCMELMSERLRRLTDTVEIISFLSMPASIAATMLKLVERHGQATGSGVLIAIKLTHQNIADMANCSRENVTRVFAQWRRGKILGETDDGYLRVMRTCALKEIVQCG